MAAAALAADVYPEPDARGQITFRDRAVLTKQVIPTNISAAAA